MLKGRFLGQGVQYVTRSSGAHTRRARKQRRNLCLRGEFRHGRLRNRIRLLDQPGCVEKIPAGGLPRRPAIESGLIIVSATMNPLQLRGGMWLDGCGCELRNRFRSRHVHSLSCRPYTKLTKLEFVVAGTSRLQHAPARAHCGARTTRKAWAARSKSAALP